MQKTNPFHTGIIGCGGVTFSGASSFDSYDSSTNKEDLGNGNIVTLTSGAHISLNGAVRVTGNVMTFGKGSDITVADASSISGNEAVNFVRATGSVTVKDAADIGVKVAENAESIPMTNNCDPLGLPAMFKGLSGQTAQSALEVKGVDDKELSPGSYSYKGLSVSGASSLTLKGPGVFSIYIAEGETFRVEGTASLILTNGAKLNLYLSGELEIMGAGFANEAAKPADLIIISNYASSGVGIEIGGTSDLNAVIYAPFTGVKFSSAASFKGSVRGKTVANGGVIDFLYDESLAKINILKP